jgi:hypothetical protein
MNITKKLLVPMAVCSLLVLQRVAAQAPLPIYTDNLVNDFQNWSWASVNFANTAPVYSGSHSISVTASNYSALWLYAPNFNTDLYTNLSFWINGGSAGGQRVLVVGVLDGDGQPSYTLPILASNTWRQFTIPLSTLGVANQDDCNGFWWQLDTSGSAPTFYLDSVQLNPAPAPALTHIAIKATNAIRIADARWFGVNTPLWDEYFDNSENTAELNEAGFQCLRYPGGSESDSYNWVSNTTGTGADTTTWVLNFNMFAHVATNIGANIVITANYGTGTPAEAAAWVSDSNVTNHYGFKYWEIGNEIYGSWETDSNVYPHDPYTYATRAQAYIQQMRAADTNIKIGVVVTTGEDSYANYTNHPATNAATGQVHYGWTPVLLSTLSQLGVTPDFAISHVYPESGSDSDPLLLQGSTWASTASNLRGMITDYFGPGGTNIELLCTENNSDSGPVGKQSVSLVNALYYADSLSQLMQTEINAHIWWDLRNGPGTNAAADANGDYDPTLYGWRMYGDFGMMDGQGTSLTDRYPTYFAAKLMQYFVRGGDTVLSATSDYSLLSAYAIRRTNGALTLLAISKDSVSNITANIVLDKFAPASSATIYSYGANQDNAAETGTGSCDLATNSFSVSSNFNYTFAPYSLTVFSFAPTAPSLKALPSQPGSGRFVLQIGGQPGTPYVLQTSTNLSAWTSVSTNIATSSTLNVTNTLLAGAARQFWRAVWQP